MTVNMDDSAIYTVAQLRRFLQAAKGWKFKGMTRQGKYDWIEGTVRRFNYFALSKKDKKPVREYIMLATGFSRPQMNRLLNRKLFCGVIKPASGNRNKFPTNYTRQDVELLAETDNLHGRLSGPATRRIFEGEMASGDKRYERLCGISPSHIYNLRDKPAYKAKALTVSRTKSVQTSIGTRCKPNTGGHPGHLRVDTVHQGDLDGVKGVYHLNLVDEVTQWEVLACVPEINELMMQAALSQAMLAFPFRIRGFHSDNGGEYLNKKVEELFSDGLARQTKSRSGRTNDNALVEGKNGSVVRKLMGHWHIDMGYAGVINDFYVSWYNPYLNYHRPCGFAEVTVDERGRRRRKYKDYRTPCEAFLGLDKPGQYLRDGLTLDDLRKTAAAHSANGYARLMQPEKEKLFRKVLLKGATTQQTGGLAKELRRSAVG
jgi:transposase InsO family protein